MTTLYEKVADVLRLANKCTRCFGSGLPREGEKRASCEWCDGLGLTVEVREQLRDVLKAPLPDFEERLVRTLALACRDCKGAGWTVGDCHPREGCCLCRGTGRDFEAIKRLLELAAIDWDTALHDSGEPERDEAEHARRFYWDVRGRMREAPGDGWPVDDLDVACDAFEVAMASARVLVALRNDECPNCGRSHAGLYTHTCDGRGVSITHCGCYHEGNPQRVKAHVSWDCVCPKEDEKRTSDAHAKRAATESIVTAAIELEAARAAGHLERLVRAEDALRNAVAGYNAHTWAAAPTF